MGQLMYTKLLRPLVSPLFVKFGSSRIIVVGGDKKQLFDEPALVARSKTDGSIIAFGKEAAGLYSLGAKEVAVLSFFSRGIITDEQLATEYFVWMHRQLRRNYLQSFFPIPIVYSHSVGLPANYSSLLEQALRRASFFPLASYPALIAEARHAINDTEQQKPIVLIRMGATHTQIGILRAEQFLGTATIPIGGNDIDRAIVQSIRQTEGMNVPLSFVTALKEQYTKAISTQGPFSAVVRGRRVQTGIIESVQLRQSHLEPVIKIFFDTLAQRITWELNHTLAWDAHAGSESTFLLTGALCVFPEAKEALGTYGIQPLRIVGRAPLAGALGLVSLWQH